jgi:plasmid stability protein
MKKPVLLNLEDDLHDALRERAHTCRTTVSAYVRDVLRKDLGVAPTPEQVRDGMSERERVCMDAYMKLVEDFEEDEKHPRLKDFSLKQIARAAGLYPSEALKGLRALERRGLLSAAMMGDPDWPTGPRIETWVKARGFGPQR